MKIALIVLCVAVAAFADEKYDSSNDDFNLAEVLENERLLNSYAKCLLNKGPCPPEAKKLKDNLPEALETRCAKCTDKQKQMGKQVSKELKSKHPEIWNELVALYDPNGKYQEAFNDFLKDYKTKGAMFTLCVIFGTLLTVASADFYSSRYDDFDIQPLLENDRILQGYTKCFLDQGPCTPDAKDFKKAIPEALETSCGKCTPKQKQLIRQVIRAVMEKHRGSWDQLVEKYDPETKYRDNFNKFIEEKD
ncbi:uncharacterized protein [Epargyreus clarus]|uniref:uncharacterized protein n=1 Tax=Epargyreus clarus TaxID=520877 RepID=UPI003C2F1DA1